MYIVSFCNSIWLWQYCCFCWGKVSGRMKLYELFFSRVSERVYWNHPGTLAFLCMRTVFHMHRTRPFVQIVEEYLRNVKIWRKPWFCCAAPNCLKKTADIWSFHVQRRNQIIFTSSRASSRRRWLQTLLRRSGPRKNSRDFFLKRNNMKKDHGPRTCVQDTAVEIWSETLNVE